MKLNLVFLTIAVVLFGIGAFSRWWPASPTPWYPAFLSAGLFFYALSVLWPALI